MATIQYAETLNRRKRQRKGEFALSLLRHLVFKLSDLTGTYHQASDYLAFRLRLNYTTSFHRSPLSRGKIMGILTPVNHMNQLFI